MQLFRKALALIVITVLSITAHAQQHLAKTLLWRISGNGLQKPSYLFGTMHLTDKRLFNFDDSVYNAIEKTEGLAIEVNPDELAGYIINKAFDQMENGKRVQDMLNAKDYKKYSPALEKKFGKPADEITTTDIVKEKNKWMADYMKKGEMPTFVDAYLYSVAKRLGKWIGGIEDMSDQANLMDDMVDKSDISFIVADDKAGGNNTLEQMINTYANQDIEAIEGITNAGTSMEMKDRMLINRNIKMARRIDSLAAFRTMFFAIGAAHLPGDSGVIQLLKGRGFTVEPVISTKKIAASDYKVKEVEPKWTEIKDDNGLYTVLMPGNAAPVKLFGLVDIKFLFDLTNFSGFYTMAVVNPNDIQNQDSVYNEMAKRMFKGKKVTPKKISKGDIQGREFTQELDNMTARVQVFINGKVIYMAMAYALKKENVSSPNAEKFFNSFTVNKNYLAGAKTVVFTDSVMGISFTSPAALIPNAKLSSSADPAWKVTSFTATDMSTGSYIMLFSKEVKAGSVIISDSLVYDQFFQLLHKQYTDINVTDTALQGVRVIEVSAKNSIQTNIYAKLLTTIIGNRNVLLFVLSDSAHIAEPGLANVFTSFKFLPHPATPWNGYKAADGTFSTWAPSDFRIILGQNEFLQHVAYDTATATSYFVIPDTLGKYAWAVNDSSFWKEKANTYTYTDSIISETKLQDGQQGIELLVKKHGAKNTFKRVRMLLYGNIMFRLVVSGDRAMIFDDNANKFFANFQPAASTGGDFITNSKAVMLLDDLLSADSATRMEAFRASINAPFAEADVPLLQQALYKTYKPLHDSGETIVINSRIAERLERLGGTSTVAFVTEHYNKFGDNNEAYNGLSLALLAGIHTKESYEALPKLLSQAKLKEKPYYTFQNNLTDSLALTAGIYPQLLPYAADSAVGLIIAVVGTDLLDSSLIDIKTLQPAEKDFIALANFLLAKMKTQDEGDVDYYVYRLMELLAKFKTPQSLAVLKNYAELTNLYIREKAIIELLQAGEQVPAAQLTSIAANIGFRSAFYDDLDKIGKKELFPAQYLTQQYFAESAVYSAANDSDDEDGEAAKATLQFLSRKTAKYKGKSYTFYLFKVSYKGEDGEKSYLGVAGGYDNNSKTLEPAEELTGLYWQEEYDAKNISAQLQAFLTNRESSADETDEEQ